MSVIVKAAEVTASSIARGLAEGWISHWDTYAECPLSDWQAEVANHDTTRGYWDWVIGKFEAGDVGEEEAP